MGKHLLFNKEALNLDFSSLEEREFQYLRLSAFFCFICICVREKKTVFVSFAYIKQRTSVYNIQ